jgi:hypothetical protein
MARDFMVDQLNLIKKLQMINSYQRSTHVMSLVYSISYATSSAQNKVRGRYTQEWCRSAGRECLELIVSTSK